MYNQCKRRHRQTVDEIFCELEKTVERNTDESFFIYQLHQRLLPEIKSVARRYLNLDHALELDDFVSEGYLAVRDALLQYDEDRGKGRFSTYAYWHFQKRFENLCCKDKVVVVKIGDNQFVIPYKEFQKRKRSLPEGTEWTVESRLIPFEPFDGTNGNPEGIRSGNREVEDELLELLEGLDKVTCCSISNRAGGDFKH
jgi:RNA polymerase sigma factor (sigma-70 family)